jgi:hypothetical protein
MPAANPLPDNGTFARRLANRRHLHGGLERVVTSGPPCPEPNDNGEAVPSRLRQVPVRVGATDTLAILKPIGP